MLLSSPLRKESLFSYPLSSSSSSGEAEKTFMPPSSSGKPLRKSRSNSSLWEDIRLSHPAIASSPEGADPIAATAVFRWRLSVSDWKESVRESFIQYSIAAKSRTDRVRVIDLFDGMSLSSFRNY